MKTVDPWSPIIFKENVPVENFPEIQNRIEKIFQDPKFENTDLEKQGGISTFAYSNITGDQPHRWPELGFLGDVVSTMVPKAVDQWRMLPGMYVPVTSWVNKHVRGSWTDEHIHRGCFFVMAYYLSVPQNSGRLLVRDPIEHHWDSMPASNDRGIDNTWYPLDVEAGDVIIFPSWLRHKTEPSNSDEPRYVMSVNFLPIPGNRN